MFYYYVFKKFSLLSLSFLLRPYISNVSMFNVAAKVS